jgi:putative acetyltransferase
MSESALIRKIRPDDNQAVAGIIRAVMTEFGAVGCGYSSEDAEVDSMYQAYCAADASFYVIELQAKILGCGGMGPLLKGGPGVCELRKMYFLPELRGSGFGTRLLQIILEDARDAGFQQCYLETLSSMTGARRLYLKHGFKPIDGPMGNTGHSGCNNYMVLDLHQI